MSLSPEDLRLATIDLGSQKEAKKKNVKFIAYVHETDNGCDYTIDCGKTLWELEAKTLDEAMAELKQEIAPPLDMDEGIYELKGVTLYQIENVVNVPIKQWYEERAKQEEDYKIAQKRKQEQLEYQRLKEKYG